MTNNYFPIKDQDKVFCDVTGYDRTLFNTKLRVYREPDFKSNMGFQYYLIDLFFCIYYSGPLFWQGLVASQGTDDEMRQLAPHAWDRKVEMTAEGRDHFPKLYCIETGDAGPLKIIAGACRIYAHNSPMPLAFNEDGEWFGHWDIVFEEGFAGQPFNEISNR